MFYSYVSDEELNALLWSHFVCGVTLFYVTELNMLLGPICVWCTTFICDMTRHYVCVMTHSYVFDDERNTLLGFLLFVV